MEESILTSIKKMLGIPEDYENFDLDIMIHINSVFMILNQLGVGPEESYSIKSKENKWSEFIPEGDKNFEAVKSYIYMKVRLQFDPPASSIVVESINRMISEYEWRLNVAAESEREEELQNG